MLVAFLVPRRRKFHQLSRSARVVKWTKTSEVFMSLMLKSIPLRSEIRDPLELLDAFTYHSESQLRR